MHASVLVPTRHLAGLEMLASSLWRTAPPGSTGCCQRSTPRERCDGQAFTFLSSPMWEYAILHARARPEALTEFTHMCGDSVSAVVITVLGKYSTCAVLTDWWSRTPFNRAVPVRDTDDFNWVIRSMGSGQIVPDPKAIPGTAGTLQRGIS